MVTITNKAYEQHNKLHSNSGRAERENTRRNETPSGHVSERRVRGEARGGIRNKTSCFDEGAAAGGVQCTRNEAYAYGGGNVLGRREEKREVETGVLGVVRNEAYGVGSLGRREERSRDGSRILEAVVHPKSFLVHLPLANSCTRLLYFTEHTQWAWLKLLQLHLAFCKV